ncbi:Dihydropteroate synthase [hydrothermal vent metagenome]|uniref:dihydropteroate synthase n=1 Tax=hydrothermal vent metagenome TaxID=652676 RepID=A0A3B0RHH6_9ZZZZ
MKARLVEILSREDARLEMERLGVDPGGFSYMLPKQQHYNLKLEGLTPPAANIIKQEMLSIGAEAAVAKGTVSCRIKETGCILSGTLGQLQRFAKKMECQPYGLIDVGRAVEDALSSIKVAERGGPTLLTRSRSFSFKEQALIMGILNVTPDSFSDGGEFTEPDRAVERALEMVSEGAGIIDIGGESTRPGAEPVEEGEEIERILPVVRALVKEGVAVSIDTQKAAVARIALEAGAELVNDVSALADKDMAGVVAEFKAAVVLMHRRGGPGDMQSDITYKDIMAEVFGYLAERIEYGEASGIERERIAIDPGIGFGKDVAGNLELLRRLRELTTLGRPLLIGTSRKSFIGEVLERSIEQRLTGTLVTQVVALMAGASILRVHDVRQAREAALMVAAVRQGEGYIAASQRQGLGI